MLTCQHHISWVRQVDGGLHQCILCTQVVTKKDVYPKLEDLTEEFRRRWDAHEATRPPDAPAAVEVSAARAPEASAAPAAPRTTPTSTTAVPPIPRAPSAPRIAPPPAPADPRSGG